MMTNRLVLVLVAASAAAAPAAAQRRPALAAAARIDAAPAEAPAAPVATRRAAGGGAGRTAMQTLAGAVLGAGAGYLASQVAWSDWDKHSNSEFAGRRMSFTLGGSAVGALAGLVLGHGRPSQHTDVGTPYTPERSTHAMGAVVTTDELRASTAINLYQMLQAARPSWINGRGVGAVRAGRPFVGPGGGTSTPAPTDAVAAPAQGEGAQASASVAPRVYLDGTLIGDVNQLREMLVSEAQTVEYLDPGQATYRYGAGNQAGVILVTSLRASVPENR